MTINIYHALTDGENHFWEVKSHGIPDYERRVQHWAFAQAVEEVWHTEPPEDRGFQTAFRTERWIKTDAGGQRFAALKQRLRDILPRTWNDALVHQTLPQIWAAR
jgi:hypothetical protein